MGPGGLFGQLRGIDAFGRMSEDVRIRTNAGALITLASGLLILVLIVSEILDYRRVQTSPRLEVDLGRGERLAVQFNVTFPRIPCYLLSLDVVDVVGENQVDVHHDIERRRLDEQGRPVSQDIIRALESEAKQIVAERGPDYCGDCYGAEPPESGCCNTCDEVREAYLMQNWSFTSPDDIEQCRQEHWSEHVREQNHEGCNIAGEVRVNKVVGNLHFSPGRTFQRNDIHTHDLVPYLHGVGESVHHFGHKIHRLSFGMHDEFAIERTSRGKRWGPLKRQLGIVDALENHVGKTDNSDVMFQYFLKVVPVEVHKLNGRQMSTYQYSATSYDRDLEDYDHGDRSGHIVRSIEGIPGVFFNYEISPLRVVQTEWHHSVWHLVSNLFALIGGIVTVAGLIDGAIYRARRTFRIVSQGGYSDDADGLGMDAKLL